MRRWLLAALFMGVMGVLVAFFAVPFGPSDCPGLTDCYSAAGPRRLTLFTTGLIVFGLLAAAVASNTDDRG